MLFWAHFEDNIPPRDAGGLMGDGRGGCPAQVFLSMPLAQFFRGQLGSIFAVFFVPIYNPTDSHLLIIVCIHN